MIVDKVRARRTERFRVEDRIDRNSCADHAIRSYSSIVVLLTQFGVVDDRLVSPAGLQVCEVLRRFYWVQDIGC